MHKKGFLSIVTCCCCCTKPISRFRNPSIIPAPSPIPDAKQTKQNKKKVKKNFGVVTTSERGYMYVEEAQNGCRAFRWTANIMCQIFVCFALLYTGCHAMDVTSSPGPCSNSFKKKKKKKKKLLIPRTASCRICEPVRGMQYSNKKHQSLCQAKKYVSTEHNAN